MMTTLAVCWNVGFTTNLNEIEMKIFVGFKLICLFN